MHALLHHLVTSQKLSPEAAERLWQFADLHRVPKNWSRYLLNALALTAALLLGAGLIFWIAANWQTQTRQFKFILLQAALVVPLLGAIFFPRARAACVLLLTLAIGGLLAFVGQTYQTGADPWQLFAIWGVLAAFGIAAVRHDLGFCGLTLIWATAIGLWGGESLFNPLRLLWGWYGGTSLATAMLYLGLAVAVLGIAKLVSTPSLRYTTWLLAVTCFAAWTALGVWSLFDRENQIMYFLYAALVAAFTALAWLRKPRDFGVLAMGVFGLNILFLGGVARLLFKANSNFFDLFLLFGVLAATSIGLSGSWLYRQQKKDAEIAGRGAQA
jgi:uncharacterized membrane protein